MVDFNKMRERKGSNFSALQAKLESTEKNSGFTKDVNIWKPTANKDNKSSNIIRFLPIPYVDEVAAEAGTVRPEDLTPMAKVLRHSFQGPSGWFIESSPATIGNECAVRSFDGPQWATAKKNDDKPLQEELKKRLPKTEYYANILIIKDGTNPENNGKVMKYQFGETVRKIIEKCNKPDFETDPIFDPFDAFDGADMMLNLTYTKKKIGAKEQNVPDFAGVKWAACGPLCGGDEVEMEKAWKASHSIAEYYNPKNFKTFDELKEKYIKVMGVSSGTSGGSSKPKSAEDMINEMTSGSSVTEAKAPAEKAAPIVSKEAVAPVSHSSDISDEMAQFEALLNGTA